MLKKIEIRKVNILRIVFTVDQNKGRNTSRNKDQGFPELSKKNLLFNKIYSEFKHGSYETHPCNAYHSKTWEYQNRTFTTLQKWKAHYLWINKKQDWQQTGQQQD